MPNPYDEYHYDSFSYSLSFPEHLETVGRLFGMKPASYKQARILELGCASGGNIIPIASHFPETDIIGIDLSDKQIEQGQHIAETLALSNLVLRHQSILDFDCPPQAFDYIICHGVFSWVEEAVRAKILEICKFGLKEHGIAYISYNTLPCWNMVMSVRDMMKFHVRHFETSKEKIEQSRIFLDFLGRGLENQKTPYAHFLKDELKNVRHVNDNYLYHEYLEEVNQPFYFHEFVKKCGDFQLAYLADSHLPSMYPGNLRPSFVEKLNEINDVVKVGQYMDFIRNQRFRSTLICHQELAIDRQLKVDDVESFCLSYSGKFQKNLSDTKLNSNEALTFEGHGLLVTLTRPLFKACIKILHDNYGKPIAYAQVVEQSMKQVGESDPTKARYALNHELNLIRLVLGGLLQLHPDEGIYTGTISSQPSTTPLIRYLAKMNQPIPNLRHESLSLQPVERIILQYLDAEHSHKQIFNDLERKILNKQLDLQDEHGQLVTEQSEIKKRVQKITLSALESLVKKAYLVA